MAGQKRKIGIKAIKKALSECAIDPDIAGPMKIIAAADDQYCIKRAIEFLNIYLVDYLPPDDLQKAIGLLGLVRARHTQHLLGVKDERVQA